MGRVEERVGFDEGPRIRLLEADMDRLEIIHRDAIHELRDEIKGMSRVLVGILVSLATAGVLLAINLIVVGNK